MSEPVLRRSARNAGKRDIDTVQSSAPAPAPKKRTKPVVKAVSKAKEVVGDVAKAVGATKEASSEKDEAAPESKAVLAEGDVLPESLPTIQTHTGDDVTLLELVKKSEKGIVIFAYPRASTPGCTTQACSFRDNSESFKETGYAVYGLSGDKPSANEKFWIKQTLGDIVLLCDPEYKLHEALDIKKKPKGTIRSVIVIQRSSSGGVILKKSSASPAVSVPMAKAAIGLSEE